MENENLLVDILGSIYNNKKGINMNNKVYDFYYSYKCSKLGTIKRFFKNMPFNHAIEHGKSPDHIQWNDLMKVGTGTYDDVRVINHTESIYKGKNHA